MLEIYGEEWTPSIPLALNPFQRLSVHDDLIGTLGLGSSQVVLLS